jgi:HlyD family secretion protein
MNTEVEIQTGEATGVLLIPNNSVVMPQDAEPAALALGLDADAIDMESLTADMGNMFASGGRGGGSGARPEGGRPGGEQGAAGGGQRQSRQFGRSGQGGGGGDFDWRQFQRGGTTGAARTERALVFVVEEDGTIEPRMVMIGLTDWDRTQVVSGLEEGEYVALIGPARLQAERDEFLERMRSNMGGNPFGGGGMRGRGGYRR